MNLAKLDRATVCCIVQMLQAAGWIVRSRRVPTRRIGRPTEMLWIKSNAGLFLGLAFEADLIRMVAAGLDGKPRANLTFSNAPGRGWAGAQIKRVVRSILKACAAGPELVRHVGWGVPAPIDSEGRILPDPYFGAKDFAIIPKLQSLIQVPVRIENEANAAALAEQRFGVCRGISDFIMIHGNSGISSGLFLANSIYRGNGGLAGGLGHVKVVAKGRSCHCGGHGCLEAYVSKRALSARLFELGRDLQLVSCIADAASRGDRVVLKVLQEAGAHLGIALANLVYAVNLRHIVLGGDLAELADYLLPSIRKVLSANVPLPSGANIQLHVSTLGRDAVAFGGVALAMEGFLPVLPSGISRSSPDRRTHLQRLGKPKRTRSGVPSNGNNKSEIPNVLPH